MNFDKTYCSGDGCKYYGPCERSLTHEVMQEARRVDARVSRYSDPKSLPCWGSPLVSDRVVFDEENLKEHDTDLLEVTEEDEN